MKRTIGSGSVREVKGPFQASKPPGLPLTVGIVPYEVGIRMYYTIVTVFARRQYQVGSSWRASLEPDAGRSPNGRNLTM